MDRITLGRGIDIARSSDMTASGTKSSSVRRRLAALSLSGCGVVHDRIDLVACEEELRDLAERESSAIARAFEDPHDVESVVRPGRRHDPWTTDKSLCDRRDDVMLPRHQGDSLDLGQGLREWRGVTFEEPCVDGQTKAGRQWLDGLQRTCAAAVQADARCEHTARDRQ